MNGQIQAIIPANFGTVTRERLEVLLEMKKNHLDQKWIHTYGLPGIFACCKRMERVFGDAITFQSELQRELIQNPAFADYYANLLKAFPEELPVENTENPYGRSQHGYRYTPPKPPSRRSVLELRMVNLLKLCWAETTDITHIPWQYLMEALELDKLPDNCRLDYLRLIAPMKLSERERDVAVESLTNCVDLPMELSETQKGFLLSRTAASRELFASASFVEVCELLTNHPALKDIADFLSEMDICDTLSIDEYKAFSQAANEYRRLLFAILGCMESSTAHFFMLYWKESGYPLRELQILERQLAVDMELDLEEAFSSYAGYVNLIYGKRFKNIDFSRINGHQESILLHAIVRNKKHFIRMVDEHIKEFAAVPYSSILFDEKLYQEHLNLTELTERDLADCVWMNKVQFHTECLAPGRIYTFQEIRALYGVQKGYIALYNKLISEKQDYRLLVIRQMLKRDLIRKDMTDDILDILAARLDEKPLDRWTQDVFSKIKGLEAGDVVQMLLHMDAMGPLIPALETREDVILVLRNLENLAQYRTVAELKAHIAGLDSDWASLSEDMRLSAEFQKKYTDRIVRFVCNNGAYIANRYREELYEEQENAFLRVVKAEVMGKLDTLKYYQGDLQKEIDLDVSERVTRCWQENTCMSLNGIKVSEHDDFFSTMLVGIQPQRTCLAYDRGVYRQCLLSGFDSNKKVLYAEIDGEIVARAYLRLTKGRMAGEESKKGSAFTFVDVEQLDSEREKPQSNEQLTLFLERPYSSGIDREKVNAVKDLLIKFVLRKADVLGAVLVLSVDYHGVHSEGFTYTKYDIYISRTKAGAQYLDSLGGEATVDTEGSYQSNTFLIRNVDTSA